MAKVYFNLIKKKEITLDDVPARYVGQVAVLLEQAGLDGTGDIK